MRAIGALVERDGLPVAALRIHVESRTRRLEAVVEDVGADGVDVGWNADGDRTEPVERTLLSELLVEQPDKRLRAVAPPVGERDEPGASGRRSVAGAASRRARRYVLPDVAGAAAAARGNRGRSEDRDHDTQKPRGKLHGSFYVVKYNSFPGKFTLSSAQNEPHVSRIGADDLKMHSGVLETPVRETCAAATRGCGATRADRDRATSTPTSRRASSLPRRSPTRHRRGGRDGW